jgi:hypothetical protein
MITVESRPPKKRAPSANEEAKLQAECHIWYVNEFRGKPLNLWSTFNEGKNVSQKLSMGMVPGVSDMLYYESWGRGLIGLEFKYSGTSHNVSHLLNQASWIFDVCDCGGFVDSKIQFQRIICGENCWYSPEMIIKYCSEVKTGSIVWNVDKFK